MPSPRRRRSSGACWSTRGYRAETAGPSPAGLADRHDPFVVTRTTIRFPTYQLAASGGAHPPRCRPGTAGRGERAPGATFQPGRIARRLLLGPSPAPVRVVRAASSLTWPWIRSCAPGHRRGGDVFPMPMDQATSSVLTMRRCLAPQRKGGVSRGTRRGEPLGPQRRCSRPTGSS